MIETTMLHDHRFPYPPPRRASRFISRNWLPVTVVAAGVAVMTIALLGFSLIAWVGSTLLAGFTMSFTLFALIRSRRQMDRLKKSVDVTLTHMSINRAKNRKASRS
ncbi:hypothetical protein ACM61V_18015 [Sphingomonas sp. TX0543]|uniref:hypothetical protein n=1 Tax=Sphingomonas sp. TX0543 TaxID=3399682 RepID=UPI003AFB2ED9